MLIHLNKTKQYVQFSFLKRRWFQLMKRLFDIALSLIILIFSSPLFLWLMFLYRKKAEGSMIHRDLCVGKNGKPFKMYTFRTETVPSQLITALPPRPVPKGWEHGVSDRFTIHKKAFTMVTDIGRILKKYRLHQLPLFWNVLKGDMSIVGPEPELIEVAQYYNLFQKQRLSVKPGLTGLAQINRSGNEL